MEVENIELRSEKVKNERCENKGHEEDHLTVKKVIETGFKWAKIIILSGEFSENVDPEINLYNFMNKDLSLLNIFFIFIL